MTTATTHNPFVRLWNRIRAALRKPAAQPAPWFDGAGSAFAELNATPPPRRQPQPVAAVARPAPVAPAKLPVTTADSAGVAAAASAAAHKAAYHASVKAHDANAAAVEAALREAFAAADRPAAAATAASLRAPVVAASAPVASIAAAPTPIASAKALRSLDEVRADLARLRETTRARHAKAYEERDTNFAPTDFMDYAATKVEPRPPQFAAYAPTEFMDFSDLKLPALKSDRSSPDR